MSGLSLCRFLESIFGSELSLFLSCCGLMFVSGVFPMILLYVLAFRSRTCFREILLMSGFFLSYLGIHFGSELLFFLSCCGLLFFSGVLPMFLFYDLAFRPRTCFGKILLMSGFSLRRFLESIFGSELSFFLSCCSLLFLVVFCLCFVLCFGLLPQDMF